MGDFRALGAEEAARQFRRAAEVLEAYMQAAEGMDSVGLYVALSEGKRRVREGRRVAERNAEDARPTIR